MLRFSSGWLASYSGSVGGVTASTRLPFFYIQCPAPSVLHHQTLPFLQMCVCNKRHMHLIMLLPFFFWSQRGFLWPGSQWERIVSKCKISTVYSLHTLRTNKKNFFFSLHASADPTARRFVVTFNFTFPLLWTAWLGSIPPGTAGHTEVYCPERGCCISSQIFLLSVPASQRRFALSTSPLFFKR